MNRISISLRLFSLLLIAMALNAAAQVTLFPTNSTWKYLDNASNQGTSWIDSGFNDASWSSGSGVFGVGGITGATISTTINNEITTYFRKEITIAADNYATIDLSLLCDDGAVIYINGKEAYRDHMPSGTITYTTLASSPAIGGADEGDYTTYQIPDTFLITGVNTFAVELHNQSASSSDLGFDLGVVVYEAVDSSNYVLFKEGAWNYLDDGSNQGTTWKDSGFNDASWSSGDAVLGYGTLDGNSVTTTLSYGGNSGDKYPTTYFRKEVTLTNPNFLQLKIYLLADDAAAVYINGKLATSDGMPTSWDYLTYADFTASGTDEGDYDVYTVPDTFLINGVNTFAVEMHQVNASSSDLGFDMEIIGVKGTPVIGQIFMDMDGNGVYSTYDNFGSGAVEIRIYDDADSNGIYTPAEFIDSYLTDPHGTYELIAPEGVRHLAVKLMTEDMDDRVEYTTDTVFTFILDGSIDTAFADFGQLGPRSLCLLIADNQNAIDEYYIANRITGKNRYVATVNGHDLIEALAIKIGMDTMWACDEGQFGSVDIVTGEFTAIGTGIGSGVGLINGSVSPVNLNDIDGMAYDAVNDLLYGVHRMNGAYDLLFVINRSTGGFVEDHFGVDRDFVKIKGPRVMFDVDDIAFNPFTDQLLAVNNSGNGDSARYITIDPSDGTSSVLSFVGVGDFEGIGYYNTGELYGTTGVVNTTGYNDNTFYRIDRNTGVGTKIDTLYSGAKDVEACDCLTGPTENLISGIVFYDNDSSGTFDSNIDSAYGSIKIYLYRDANQNGVIDSGDYIIDSTYTVAGNGFYVFITDSLGYFLTTPVIDGTPLAGNNTTTGDSITEDAYFNFHGDFDGKNDFGFHITSGVPYLPVDWLEIDAAWVDPDDAIVTWSTASETNTSHYVIERKEGNNAFKAIGETTAVGLSNEINQYEYTDINAKKLETSFIHYRIKQVDFNGVSTYSEIVSLEKKVQIPVTIYPNPVGDILNIILETKGEYNILITDMLGNEVLSLTGFKTNKATPIRMEGLSQLRRGMYLVRISYNGEDTIIKLIK